MLDSLAWVSFSPSPDFSWPQTSRKRRLNCATLLHTRTNSLCHCSPCGEVHLRLETKHKTFIRKLKGDRRRRIARNVYGKHYSIRHSRLSAIKLIAARDIRDIWAHKLLAFSPQSFKHIFVISCNLFETKTHVCLSFLVSVPFAFVGARLLETSRYFSFVEPVVSCAEKETRNHFHCLNSRERILRN